MFMMLTNIKRFLTLLNSMSAVSTCTAFSAYKHYIIRLNTDW